MADQVSTLALGIDTTGIAAGEKALDGFATAGKGAQDAATQLEAAVRKTSDASNQTAASTNTMAATYGRLAQSSNAYLAALQREVAVYGQNRAGVAAYDAAVMKLSASEQAAARSLGSQIDALEREEAATKALAASQEKASAAIDAMLSKLNAQAAAVGKTASQQALASLAAKGATQAQLDAAAAALKTIEGAKGSASALDHLSFSSAGVKREVGFLASELSRGNFAQFEKSMVVLAQRAGAFSLVMTPLGATIAGVAAAVGLFALAAAKGAEQSEVFYKAMILSGNAAGTTYTQLQAAAKGISAVVGAQSTAADALAQLAASGAVGAENLEKFGLASVEFERSTGQAIGDTVKQFVELGRSPVEASAKLNESLHYLTATTFEQIKALDDQGRSAEAAAAAQTAYADAMLNRSAEIQAHLGFLQKAWLGIIDAAKGAWNAMLNVGKEDSTGQQLAVVSARVDQQRAKLQQQSDPTKAYYGGGAEARAADAKSLASDLAEQQSLTRRALLEDNVAASARARAQAAESAVRWAKEGDSLGDKDVKKNKEIAQAKADALALGKSQEETDKRIAAINEKYSDAPKVSTPRNTDRSTLNEDLGNYKDVLTSKLDAYKNSQSMFDTLRSAGLRSDQQYYDQERVQLELYEAANVAEIDSAIARRKAQTFTGPNAENNQINNAREINKLQTERAKVQADTAAASQRLDVQQESSNQRRRAAYQANELAAARQLDATKRQYDLELSLSRLGPQEAQRQAGRAQIADSYDAREKSERDAFSILPKDKDGKVNADAQDAFNEQIGLIQKYREKALSEYDGYYARRKQQDANYQVGLDRATATYIENAQDVAKLTEQAYTNTFSSIEDALVGFVTTGKLNFKSLADSIIAEFVRIEVKQATSKFLSSFSEGNGTSYSSGLLGLVGGIAGLFTGSGYNYSGDASGSLFSSSGDAIRGRRAAGGSVSSGGLYEVNERGPELLQSGGKQYLMMGSQGGNVVPNGGSSNGSGGVKIDQSGQTINVGQGVSRAEFAAALRSQANATEQRIRRLSRNGNL